MFSATYWVLRVGFWYCQISKVFRSLKIDFFFIFRAPQPVHPPKGGEAGRERRMFNLPPNNIPSATHSLNIGVSPPFLFLKVFFYNIFLNQSKLNFLTFAEVIEASKSFKNCAKVTAKLSALKQSKFRRVSVV